MSEGQAFQVEATGCVKNQRWESAQYIQITERSSSTKFHLADEDPQTQKGEENCPVEPGVGGKSLDLSWHPAMCPMAFFGLSRSLGKGCCSSCGTFA